MAFNNVIGQDVIKHHLVEMVQQNRLSHALLFLGTEGGGALALAIAFAQYIVCENVPAVSKKGGSLFTDKHPGISNEDQTVSDACGFCNACLKAQKLIHPDIHFSFPVIPKKPGDKPVSTDYIS